MRLAGSRVAVAGIAVAAAAGFTLAGGCSGPCCTFDSLPIPLLRAPQGELVARVDIGGERRQALVDTGTPLTLLDDGQAHLIDRRDLDILGSLVATDAGAAAAAGAMAGALPVRARLRGVTMVHGPVHPIEGLGATTALLGGDLWAGFALEIGFAEPPHMVLWARQPASDGFLAEAGYAVLRVPRAGSGETEDTVAGGFGPSGPYQFPPSMLSLRACAVPAPFDPLAPPPARCCPGDERTLATGVDLSLVLGTGMGPIILRRSAWERIKPALPAPPVETERPLLTATHERAGNALWTTLPRLALVDREADPSVNPGACVELGRARRLELVDRAQAFNADRAPCSLPCDNDPANPERAQNSAAYIQLQGELPVAVVEDGDPLLVGRTARVFPDAPQVDGILGAGALRTAHVEIDYRPQPARVIFSCESDRDDNCRSVGRCPRLPGPGQKHTCFPTLPAHALPATCDNRPAACP